MPKSPTLTAMLLAALILLATGDPALALIKEDKTVSRRYAVASTVFVGTVTAVNADTNLIEATATQTVKGPPAPQKFQLQSRLPALLKAVAVGQPVVILAKGQAVVHIADGWYGASRNPNPPVPTWVINQVDNTGHSDFPGSTADLIRVMTELAGGKYSLLDKVDTKPFQGGAKLAAKLNLANPTFLLAADVNGDGKPDLLVGTANGVRLFLADGDAFSEATQAWGLAGVSASAAAAGDLTGSGKVDLLLDKTLYQNAGGKFVSQPSALLIDGDAHVVASALKPFTAGKLPDAAMLLDDGRLLAFKNPGNIAGAWAKTIDHKLPLDGRPLAAAFGDFSADGSPAVVVFTATGVTRLPLTGDAPPADFPRLTGDPLKQIKGFASPLKNVRVTPIDLNGDGRDDLFVTVDGASMAMVYRGFGAFLCDADMAAEIKGLPFPMSTMAARAAVPGGGKGPRDLYILAADGSVFLATNAGR